MTDPLWWHGLGQLPIPARWEPPAGSLRAAHGQALMASLQDRVTVELEPVDEQHEDEEASGVKVVNGRKCGTEYAYQRGCRCDRCRAAHAAMVAKVRGNAARRGLPEGDSRHGTKHAYVHWMCRCDACREAKRLDDQRYRPAAVARADAALAPALAALNRDGGVSIADRGEA